MLAGHPVLCIAHGEFQVIAVSSTSALQAIGLWWILPLFVASSCWFENKVGLSTL